VQNMKFNSVQFFSLMYMYLLGTAIFLDPGKRAHKDAWLAILVGLAFGLLLFWMYVRIYLHRPDEPFTLMLKRTWGKYIGSIVSLLYIVYAITIASRNLRDFSELILIVAFENTSIVALVIMLLFLLIYTILKGFTPLARTAWICFLITTFLMLIIIGSEFVSGNFKLERLQPILEQGWKPLLTTIFPITITVPFGESVFFLMLLSHMDQPGKVMKVGLWAMVGAGLLLTLTAAMHVGNLGVKIVDESIYPVILNVSLINIGDFFTNMESLVVIIFVLMGFIKIAIIFFCAVTGAVDLFGLRDEKNITFLLGILILFLAVFTASSYTEYIQGNEAAVFFHLPFQFILPFLLFLTIQIKKLRSVN
jgi:spore germination protein KB